MELNEEESSAFMVREALIRVAVGRITLVSCERALVCGVIGRIILIRRETALILQTVGQ